MVNLDDYQGVVKLNKEKKTVKVRAGTKVHQLEKFLNENGYCLETVGVIDQQSIAGKK